MGAAGIAQRQDHADEVVAADLLPVGQGQLELGANDLDPIFKLIRARRQSRRKGKKKSDHRRSYRDLNSSSRFLGGAATKRTQKDYRDVPTLQKTVALRSNGRGHLHVQARTATLLKSKP
jgi:hypothetical protein